MRIKINKLNGELISTNGGDGELPANATLQGNTFNGPNQLVKTNAAGLLPALDGSNLTNLPASGGSTIQTETQDYYDRIIAAGGSIDADTLNAVDKFVANRKADGSWSRLLDIGLFLGTNLSAALVKLKYTANSGATVVNENLIASDYSQNKGIGPETGNTNKALATGFIPSANGCAYNDITFAAGICDNTGAQNTFAWLAGSVTHASATEPTIAIFDGSLKLGNNNNGHMGTQGPAVAVATQRSTAYGLWNNVVKNIHSVTAHSSFDVANEILFFKNKRQNDNIYFANGKISCYAFGLSVTDEQAENLNFDLIELQKKVRNIQPHFSATPFGDSITAGSSAADNNNLAKNTWSRTFCRKIGAYEINVSQGSSQLSQDVSGRFYAGINRYKNIFKLKANILPIMYGTNDLSADSNDAGDATRLTTYKNNLTTIVNDAIMENISVIISSPPYNTGHAETKTLAYVKAAAEVAKATKVPFADTYRIFTDTGNAATHMNDTLHPKASGHALIAEQVFEAYNRRLVRKPTLDFPSIPAGAIIEETVTVLNAEPGMGVSITPVTSLPAGLICLPGNIIADDTVIIRLWNTSSSAIDPTATKFNVTVFLNY